MLINDVCKICRLTKKAIEYYVEQGLISPKVCENGYRDFSQWDVEKLKKISLLRKLDLGIENIRRVLNSHNPAKMLHAIAYEKELELDRAKVKRELLEKLAQGSPWEEVGDEAERLSEKQTILVKLLAAFPGYYGRFICLHFGRFLDEPIATIEQRNAYDIIVGFLDSTPTFLIPPELESFMDEATQHMNTDDMKSMSANMAWAVQNFEEYMVDNKEFLERYISYKNSDEYKNSLAYKLQSSLYNFNKLSGYYDVFIPNMKTLSPKYKDYHDMLALSNKVMASQYPDIEKWRKE